MHRVTSCDFVCDLNSKWHNYKLSYIQILALHESWNKSNDGLIICKSDRMLYTPTLFNLPFFQRKWRCQTFTFTMYLPISIQKRRSDVTLKGSLKLKLHGRKLGRKEAALHLIQSEFDKRVTHCISSQWRRKTRASTWNIDVFF